jgi:hypothetical protein
LIFRARDLVKDVPVLPFKEARFASQSRIVRLVRLTAYARINSSKRGHPRTRRAHRLPELSYFTHTKEVGGQRLEVSKSQKLTSDL